MTLSALLCSGNCSEVQFSLKVLILDTQKIPLSLFGPFQSKCFLLFSSLVLYQRKIWHYIISLIRYSPAAPAREIY